MAAVLAAASRESLAQVGAQLDAYVDGASAADAQRLGEELFEVARLLVGEKALRRHLADPAVPESARVALVERLFGQKLARPTLDVVSAAVSARWSRTMDLVDALEILSRRAVLTVAEKAGNLDDVEDELFRFGRILDREPELALLLADESQAAETRITLLDRVLGNRVSPVTATLLRQAVRLPRGRHLDVVAEELAEMAAERRDRSVAHVSTPVRLSPQQEQKLTDTLGRIYGRPMSLQIELDESLLGGLIVKVGGEVIDGSVAGKLAAARRLLPH